MFRTITPILLIVVAGAVVFFYVKPTYEEIGMTQQDLSEHEDALAKVQDFNRLLESYIARIDSFTATEMERLDALVADDINRVQILVDLKELAEKNGVLFGNVDVSEGRSSRQGGSRRVARSTPAADDAATTDEVVVTGDDFETKSVSFDIIGTYDQLRSFLQDVERSLVMLEITNLTFDVLDGDLQQFHFDIEAYALKPFQNN